MGRVTREKAPFDLVRCGTCGLIRRDPLPTPADLARLYESDYWLEFGVPDIRSPGFIENKRRKARHRISFLEKHSLLPTPGSLLEIGSAEGQFLSEMKARGWRIRGIEPDRELARTSAADLEAPVAAGMFPEALPSQTQPFDLITAFHVIEHALSPREVLNAARGLLAKDGLLYLAVPDAGAVGLTLEHPIFRACHLYSFTTQTLGHLLQVCGFEPLWFGPSDVCGKPELKAVARATGGES